MLFLSFYKNCTILLKLELFFLFHAGKCLNFDVINRLSKYITSDTDILFPVKNRVYEFIKNPLNGLLINKKIYNKIGLFGKDNPENIMKLLCRLFIL